MKKPTRDEMIEAILDDVYRWEPWRMEEFIREVLREKWSQASDEAVKLEYERCV